MGDEGDLTKDARFSLEFWLLCIKVFLCFFFPIRFSSFQLRESRKLKNVRCPFVEVSLKKERVSKRLKSVRIFKLKITF